MFTNVNKPLFTFVLKMKWTAYYKTHFRSELKGRYITNKHVEPLLKEAKSFAEISVMGSSEEGRSVYKVTLGHGPKKVLAWSQMHGNESTTTKAIFDFLKFFGQKEVFQKEIERFLAEYTLVTLPILNPDGAHKYTRENANDIDLNRDAKALTQRESLLLRKVFDEFEPDLCLNLHDQRSIYGTNEGLPAAIAFLAPSEDTLRTVTTTRIVAMEHIVRMVGKLSLLVPDCIARYDDTFNENCVGDKFTMMGVPTILFEAGQYKDDYQRENTRELIFYAFLELFGIGEIPDPEVDYKEYFKIPENKSNFKDIILRNVRIHPKTDNVSIAIQFQETLDNGRIIFEPLLDSIGNLNASYGHYENDCEGAEILLNYHKNYQIGEKIVTITNALDRNIVYYSKK